MGTRDTFQTRGKSLKRKRFLLLAPLETAVQQNSQRGPENTGLARETLRLEDGFLQRGNRFTAEFAFSRKIRV